MIAMDQKDVNQLFKRLDQIERGYGVILRKLESLADNVNQVDKDLGILPAFHLDHGKIHGELQTNTDHLNQVIEEVKDNTKVTEAIKEDIIEKIEEQNGSTE